MDFKQFMRSYAIFKNLPEVVAKLRKDIKELGFRG
jgi:hypothetical protein